MDERPEISSSRALSSWVSAVPRMEPMTLVMKPSDGVSLTLRWRAFRRLLFDANISFVASNPACFLDTSASVTGRGFAPNVCHGFETAAKPESRAINDIPIIPTLSRQASLNPFPGCEAIVCIYVPGIPFPSHQNPVSQPANSKN